MGTFNTKATRLGGNTRLCVWAARCDCTFEGVPISGGGGRRYNKNCKYANIRAFFLTNCKRSGIFFLRYANLFAKKSSKVPLTALSLLFSSFSSSVPFSSIFLFLGSSAGFYPAPYVHSAGFNPAPYVHSAGFHPALIQLMLP